MGGKSGPGRRDSHCQGPGPEQESELFIPPKGGKCGPSGRSERDGRGRDTSGVRGSGREVFFGYARTVVPPQSELGPPGGEVLSSYNRV